MTDIAISVQNVSKQFKIPHERVNTLGGAFVNRFRKGTFETFNALQDVSFDIKKGDFFGIIGRNGSGKSTLLKILAGIYQPDRGKVIINGQISPFLELGIGFNYELSGRDNIYLNGSVLGLTKKEIDKKFVEIVAFSELERFIDQKLKNYSSGMQVRLAFSVAIHSNRDILLMDEVLAVGDSNFQQKCLTNLNRLKKEGKTIVLVSHSLQDIEQHCGKAVYLDRGSIKASGKALDVANKYVLDNLKLAQQVSVQPTQISKDIDHDNNQAGQIIGVDFLDDNKIASNIFVTGQPVIIRIHFAVNEILDNPVIGIALYKDMTHIIYGTNTIKRGLKLPKILPGNHHVDFVFPKLLLLDGDYQLAVALGSKATGLIEKKDRDYQFTMQKGLSQDYGMISLEPTVNIH